ncbi:oligosaccharide flippase family protein [Paenibacillus sp. HJL G12]|uniref:Oligosaccharide flippase family protein n=1 Tax=Paenibacillus dendrobii TaxID=2691084 RepID=A0A7X3LJU8_9BACL|nr:polysaccharide biosynthesis protein [Paenibacillus dendrobii]MWV47572.1 oligosaccharide flippase family protein [Paenibacillus dendrobii]
MREEGTSSKILQGALVLSIAMVLSKLIGTLQKIPLQNMGGDVVFGIYNTVYPFYTLMITVALIGFPAAISKFVAEDAALGGRERSRQIIRIASVVMTCSGILFGAAIYLGAPLIGTIIGNASVVPALKASAIALLFVPLMSGLRGFFQGYQDMMPTAVSQITEQSVRVAVMIVLLIYLTSVGASAEHIAAGALFGSAAGGAAGLAVMGGYWRSYRKGRHMAAGDMSSAGNERKDRQQSLSLLGSMLKYAVPVCLGALAISLVNLADTFTMPRLLKSGGAGDAGAMIQFGIYNRGMPVVQLITMLATSLSVLFIPALAEARVQGDKQLVANRCRLSLRWFWLVGMAASIGIAVLAMPINIALYQDETGTSVIRWIAFTAVGSALSIISAALLQGIGIVKAPAVHLLAAAAVKTLLNLLLVPQLGITGAAIASVAAHFLAAALNIALLSRRTGLRISTGTIGKPAAILAGMALAAGAAMLAADALLSAIGLHARLTAAAASLAGAATGGAVFLAGAARTRLLSEQELRMLPKIGAPLAVLLRKLRLFA